MQLFEGELEKIRLQKLLFLFTQSQEAKAFDFVPYKFGCYSYSANADLTAMTGRGIVSETENHFKSNEKGDYLISLKESDRKQLLKIKQDYGTMSANALMKHTYVNFPYWATKSIKAQSMLSDQELEHVKASLTNEDTVTLFTIGYEGISLEEYLNRLIRNNVKVLVDVRNNPLSMKYGFSKSQLKRFCENLGLLYVHLPEVGIQSEQRQQLKDQIDYDKLFEVYRKNNLTKTIPAQTEILLLLQEHKRIALTCFEANICQCHRKHLAEAIEKLPGFKYTVKHI